MMVPKKYFALMIILVTTLAAILSACQATPASPTASINLPNPASVYCGQNGGQLELRQDASGGAAGVCVFPDGSECDEWAFYRGECGPAGALQTAAPVDNAPLEPVEEPLAGGWQLYRNEEHGYRFEYPPDTEIRMDSNPQNSLTISGRDASNEFWPQITLSHPSDREEYRPPEGASLEEWLTANNLLPEGRQPDTNIAGTTAIHTRHDRSPQSYAFDRYYFAHAGQLYEVVIGHVADHEDWQVYNRFLESITFDE